MYIITDKPCRNNNLQVILSYLEANKKFIKNEAKKNIY